MKIKMRLIVDRVIEFNPAFYDEGITEQQIIEVEKKNILSDPLLFCEDQDAELQAEVSLIK